MEAIMRVVLEYSKTAQAQAADATREIDGTGG
jgi:hypothetical protein